MYENENCIKKLVYFLTNECKDFFIKLVYSMMGKCYKILVIFYI